MHGAREKPSQIVRNMIKDLYTAVMKKPKDGSADDTKAVPCTHTSTDSGRGVHSCTEKA
jgi:hypothetical protein